LRWLHCWGCEVAKTGGAIKAEQVLNEARRAA